MDPAVRDPSGAVLLSPETVRHLVTVLRHVTQHAAGRGDTLPAALLDLLRVLADPVAELASTGSDPAPSGSWIGCVAAARRAGTSDTAVRRAAQRGTLRASKVDGMWVTTPQAVDEWTERHRVGRRASVLDRVAEDEVRLRGMVAEVESELTAIEARMGVLEVERDAAQALAAAGDAAGTPLECWAASERADQAAREIADLVARRRPLYERRTTAVGILGPLDARRREIAEQTVVVRVHENLSSRFLTAIDAAIEAFDTAAADLRAEGLGVNMHTTLRTRQFVQAWRPGGSARDSFERQINPVAARERLDHLRQEAA